MTAETLRRAAALMRERAEQVEAGEWYDATDELVWALNENCGTLSAYDVRGHGGPWRYCPVPRTTRATPAGIAFPPGSSTGVGS